MPALLTPSAPSTSTFTHPPARPPARPPNTLCTPPPTPQASSAGSILSFVTGDAALSRALCEAAELHKITVSFGNVTSLISMPCFMSHASIPAEVRAARGLPDDLVRISVGIEDVEDLLDDLDQAFQRAAAAVGVGVGAGTQQQAAVGRGR